MTIYQEYLKHLHLVLSYQLLVVIAVYFLIKVHLVLDQLMRTRWTGRVTAESAAGWHEGGAAEVALGEALGAFELGSTVIVLLSERLRSALGQDWQPREPGAPLRLGEALLEG